MIFYKFRNGILAYEATYPEVDWDHNLLYWEVLADDANGNFEWIVDGKRYNLCHRPKTEYDYKMDLVQCYCCMEEVCTCEPPHPH